MTNSPMLPQGLKTCPFCNDPMRRISYPNADYLEHSVKNIEDCPIRDIHVSDIELWNTRARPTPEAGTGVEAYKIFQQWLDKKTNFTMSMKIVAGQALEHTLETIDQILGESHVLPAKPSLDEEGVAEVLFLAKLDMENKKEFHSDVIRYAQAKAILAKFSPSLPVVLPERKNHQTSQSRYDYISREYDDGFNQALDLCRAAIEQAGGRVE